MELSSNKSKISKLWKFLLKLKFLLFSMKERDLDFRNVNFHRANTFLG